ncbi:MAG: hypothetical protein ABS934_13325 [Psychrobacillus sp.]
MRMAKVGVLLDREETEKQWGNGENVFDRYLEEILDHVRLPYKKIDSIEELDSFDLMIVACCPNTEAAQTKILDYVENGGTVISYGDLHCLKERLGFSSHSIPTIGYAELSSFLNQSTSLRYLHADPWVYFGEQLEIQQFGVLLEGNGDALLQIKYGKGTIERWAVSIPQTIVGLQQGTAPITEDGVPAPDGSANLDEEILKADDGFMLDWDLDRTVTETGMPYFPHPYADLWREALIEHLVKCALDKNLTLPFIDYWPVGVDHVALISHDSDLNVDESAQITLDTLKEEGVQSTWCMIVPGYNPSLYNQIKADGHELALHYNALESDNGIWAESAFHAQLTWLQQTVGIEQVTSNKNHYTRFEGWGELFTWCEKYGIQADQSRGPSKRGNIGFLFGTCQPYFPIAWADEKNRMYDVLEIGFLTQDLNHNTLADATVIEPFLEGVKRVNGVAHFLFHQIHIYQQPPVREAIIQLIRMARQQGFSFWTSKQINDWERARRQVKIIDVSEGNGVVLNNNSFDDKLVILMPVPEEDAQTVKRFGLHCKMVSATNHLLKEA